MRRFQARAGAGRWTRSTPENTLGLHIAICPVCRVFNPSQVGEPRPDVCHACGAPLAVCAHGRCTDPFPMPPFIPECGKPAVACDVEHRWPLCEDHKHGDA